jgi:hypothetical protein
MEIQTPVEIQTARSDLELLKRVPQEHYTEYNGKSILVKDLVKILKKIVKKG